MDLVMLGARIRAAREHSDMTQEELAQAMGLRVAHIQMLEQGEKPPKVETLVNLSNLLAVSPEELLQDSITCPREEPYPEFSDLLSKLSPEDRWRAYCSLRAFVECTPTAL